MCAMLSAPRRRRQIVKPCPAGKLPGRAGMVISEPGAGVAVGAGHSYVNLGESARVTLMITPQGRGTFSEQTREVVSVMRTVLEKQPAPMVVTVQTVFLKDSQDQAECERILAEFSPSQLPVTNYVLQPPCCGAALAVEAWAIGGQALPVELKRH